MKKNDNDDLLDLIFLGIFSIASFIIIGACLNPDDLPEKRSKELVEAKMLKAVNEEHYELAARLRDELRRIDRSSNNILK